MLKKAHGRLLLIRADGGSQIGFGHLMRSVALAEEWLARGGLCIWATTDRRALDAAGTGREDIEVIEVDAVAGSSSDALITRQIAERVRADWVSVDLPALQPEYFASAGSRGANWLIIHDCWTPMNERIHAILNPSPQAATALAPRGSSKCLFMLGLEYVMIRDEIRATAQKVQRSHAAPQKILLTFGGTDLNDLTGRTLEALAKCGLPDGSRVRTILGPSYRGRCAASGGSFGKLAVEFVRYTSNMGNHYAWSDLVLCGSGMTLWEAMLFGLPAVVLPATPGQRAICDALQGSPTIRRFDAPGQEIAAWLKDLIGDKNSPAASWFQKSCLSGQLLVDGLGAARVVDRLLTERDK